MAKNEPEYLSKSAYARTLGIDESAIRKAIAQGKIKNGYDAGLKKIIKNVADKEFGFQHKIVKVRSGVSKDKMAVRLKSEESPKNKSENSDFNPASYELQNTSEIKRHKSEFFQEKRNQNSENKRPSKPNKVIKSGDDSEDDDDYELSGLDFNPNATIESVIELISVTPYLTYADALTKREIIGLALDKLKIEELNRTLVKKSDVEKVLFTFGAQIKKSLMAIPSRVADELLHAENKVEIINILNTELTEMLTAFANFEDLKLDKN